MVNTRRMESNGSPEGANHRSTRARTSSVKQEIPEEGSSSQVVSESDSNYSGDKSFSKPTTTPLPRRQLRSRFSYPETNYVNTRPSKRISLDERTIRLYSHKMHDDSDLYEHGNESEEELYRARGTRTRHLIRMNRIQRRTALSLRPVSQKCYTDPHSPLHFNSDSEGRVRRSKRKRPDNMSWLDDSQMHKVGYPNLNAGYSEEDSRDAVDAHTEIEITRRTTRRGSDLRLRHEPKPSKYIYEYGMEETRRTRKREIQKSVKINEEILVARTSNDNENSKEDMTTDKFNGRPRRSRNLNGVVKRDISEEENEPDGMEEKTEEIEKPKVNGKVENEKQGDDKKEESSESEEEEEQREQLPTTRLRPTRNRSGGVNNSMRPYSESVRPVRTRKVSRIDTSSESEEEEGPKYSLRDRRAKAAPKIMQQSVLKTRRLRPRFTRRRQASSSSNDSSSSSSDVRRNKQPKSPHHSKNEKMKSGAGGVTKIVPIKPETLDSSIRFNSIGGLDSHVQCLKEMILLPMMYPEVFRQFHIQPPRGVLFHGPPGTGKTLIARALANECSFGKRKVSFFLRKGADLLSKWIGESERQLRLLFEQAAQMKPSIIFFDELDGLAPVRSSRQDQVHASIVSTLLALMDGLSDRGEVIVIGATNRIDAIDPALRRPGRFDRELFFPLPSKEEREEILNVHTALWKKPPRKPLLEYLAENTVGYCGSDLRALCSEAVIQSFRRTYPQVYSSEYKLLLQPENVKVEKVDFMRAKSTLVPASHRITQGLGRKLFPILEPLLQDPLNRSLDLIRRSFPHGLSTALAKVKLSPNLRPGQLLITGNGPEHGQTSHVAPAILYKMEHIHAYMLNLVMLYQDTNRSTEEACIKVFNEARKNVPSIIYIPNIDKWWLLVSETVRAIFKSQLNTLDPNIPILFLATSEALYDNLPTEVQKLFSHYRKEVLEMKVPNAESRRLFFKSVILDSSLKSVRRTRELPKSPPPLPRAPTPPPEPLDEEQSKKLYEEEEHTLRELRIFLRDMCKKLANNKLFFMFTKPVDTEEVPDYTNIIKEPMDLETMMTKVDFHRYECAKDFLNDIELICQNALEYNPARSSADKQIRHRACSLRDYAYTLIKTEMDTDFETKCQVISKKRRDRKHCQSKYLPPYINTPEVQDENINHKYEPNESNSNKNGGKIEPKSSMKKRKMLWQKGHIKKKVRKITENSNQNGSSYSDSKDDEINSKSSPLVKSDMLSTPKRDCSSQNADNCDMKSSNKMDMSSPPQSPKRRLSDILSPSELLDNPLDFDDVDEALNETATESNPETRLIDCSPAELEKLLDSVVKITDGFSLVSLLDLYNQLSRIVKKFSNTQSRSNLPKELAKELTRFKKEGAPEYKPHSSP